MKTPLQKKTTQTLALCLFASITFTACKKDKALPEVEKETIGAYILSEGAFPDGNSTLDYYDIKTKAVQKNYFQTTNSYALGKNATDLKVYGSKMYCTVTGKSGDKNSYVEVISVATGKSLKRIPFFENTTSFLPRSIVFHQSKAYVTGYDGSIRRIDTAALTIEATLKIDDVLEGAAIANNKLYVAKTDYYLIPSTIKNAVTVVNLSTFTKIKDITVSNNPSQLSAAANGDVFVQAYGYWPEPASFDKISSATDTKTATYSQDILSMSFSGTKPLVGVTAAGSVKNIDLATGTMGSNFIADNTEVKTAYAITVNNLNQDIYISDAMNYGPEGIVYAFNTSGQKQFSFPTSAIPKHIVFKYNK